jgi:hypothetical protein
MVNMYILHTLVTIDNRLKGDIIKIVRFKINMWHVWGRGEMHTGL